MAQLTLEREMTSGEHNEPDQRRMVITYRVMDHPTNPDLAVWEKVDGSKRCMIWRGSAWEGDFASPAAALAFIQAELDGEA